MERILFRNVMPAAFDNRCDINSEIWGKNFDFCRGGIYLVEAVSGKGKSTLCSYLTGYRNDYSGTILMDDKDINNLRVADWVRIRRCNISLLHQELRLFPELTAFENVEIKNRLTGFKEGKTIMQWFERLGIADKMNTKVGQMSFGQQQRVALMRALAQPFDFLLADEPISHLDDENAAIIGEIMLEEARHEGAAIIVTSIGKHIELNYERTLKL
ncbi:MAG: ATP-binding cassette domain-containing protein [Prevotella sp.]